MQEICAEHRNQATLRARISSRFGEIHRSQALLIPSKPARQLFVQDALEQLDKAIIAHKDGPPETACELLIQRCLICADNERNQEIYLYFTRALAAARRHPLIPGTNGEDFTQFAFDLNRSAKPASRADQLVLCDIFLDICDHQRDIRKHEFSASQSAGITWLKASPVVYAIERLKLAFPVEPTAEPERSQYLLRKKRIAQINENR